MSRLLSKAMPRVAGGADLGAAVLLGVTRGGYGCHQGGLPFSLRGVKFNPFNPPALRSASASEGAIV